MNIPSLILHHYTSGNGLLGILESQSIWATKIQYMNDSKEFKHAIELAEGSLRSYQKKHNNPETIKSCKLINQLLGSISDLAIYVTCFSEVADSLSQWRGCCPPSFGYSIGFNGDRLKEIAQEQGFQLNPCIYNYNIKKEKIDNWVEASINTLGSVHKSVSFH